MLHNIRKDSHRENPLADPGMFDSALLPSIHLIEFLGQPGLRASSEVHHDLEGLCTPLDWFRLSKKTCKGRNLLIARSILKRVLTIPIESAEREHIDVEET